MRKIRFAIVGCVFATSVSYGKTTDGAYYLLTPELATNIANAVVTLERQDFDASNKWYDAVFDPGIDPVTGKPWRYPTNSTILAARIQNPVPQIVAENCNCAQTLESYAKEHANAVTRRETEPETNKTYRIGGGYILVDGEQMECDGIEFNIPTTRDGSPRVSFYIYAEYNIASNTARLVKGNVLPDCTFSKEYAVTPVYYFEAGKRQILDCTTIPTVSFDQ